LIHICFALLQAFKNLFVWILSMFRIIPILNPPPAFSSVIETIYYLGGSCDIRLKVGIPANGNARNPRAVVECSAKRVLQAQALKGEILPLQLNLLRCTIAQFDSVEYG
jgi:hypothetical protein